MRARRGGEGFGVRANIPERIVSRWVGAFNARDLDGMLACLAEDVDLHPLWLSGLAGSYRGRDGVREWFAELEDQLHEHQIVPSEALDLGDGRVLAWGRLSVAGGFDVGPFSGLHRIDGGRIVAAHHYRTDPDWIERVGLIP